MPERNVCSVHVDDLCGFYWGCAESRGSALWEGNVGIRLLCPRELKRKNEDLTEMEKQQFISEKYWIYALSPVTDPFVTRLVAECVFEICHSKRIRAPSSNSSFLRRPFGIFSL